MRQSVRQQKTIPNQMVRSSKAVASIACKENGLPAPDELQRTLRALDTESDRELQHKKEVEQLNRWFNLALNNMVRGLSMFDDNQRLIVCNDTYREIYNLPKHLAKPGTPLSALVRHHVKRETGRDDPSELRKQREWIKHHVAELARGKTFSHTQHLKSGRIVLVTNRPLEGGGWVDIQEDITERRLAEQKISWLARHDPLTELSNRLHFREALEATLQKPKGGFALFWIDLDYFKKVNDTHGHPAGDALLKKVAGRLRATVREKDIVARLGGDEFAILQKGVTTVAAATRLAKRLLEALTETHVILGQKVTCSASIGITIAPRDGANAEDLLKCADLALYTAKSAGRGAYAFYTKGMEQADSDRHQLEIDLRAAVDENQLELYYQPIVDFQKQHVSGFEALMRWHHPTRGLISPDGFIPIAEESGAIVEMGAWALKRACTEAAKWPSHTRVTVNLSPVQFERGNVYQAVLDALKVSGLAPQRLELEITESVLLRDEANTHEILHSLRSLGVCIALDDFGTAYASLSYLRSFPFDKIKIDRSFVRDLDFAKRTDCVAIINAVSGLAREMKMSTVAEGVETLDHAKTVTAAGCNELQGFFFSQPVPAHDIDKVFELCREKFQEA